MSSVSSLDSSDELESHLGLFFSAGISYDSSESYSVILFLCVMYVSVVRPDAEADLRAQRQELRDVCAE